MAKAEASVEELVSMIERGELRLPQMQRRIPTADDLLVVENYKVSSANVASGSRITLVNIGEALLRHSVGKSRDVDSHHA